MTSGDPEPLPVERFDYELPAELIAQTPIEPRDAARLLVVSRADRSLTDRAFRELPELLRQGDLLVVNDTRVMPARLVAQRASGGRVELLLLSRQPDGRWRSLARPARRLRPGEWLALIGHDDNPVDDSVKVVKREHETMIVEVPDDRAIQRHGRVPLPPYIRDSSSDPERYKTIYSRETGSAAAPTAG
ncbi:MAG: S-adenosylmethionine:tRNA ribosyltransferase-isomerase, partial [Thermomicrobiales bacterium]